jgi:hypothetical protein
MNAAVFNKKRRARVHVLLLLRLRPLAQCEAVQRSHPLTTTAGTPF